MYVNRERERERERERDQGPVMSIGGIDFGGVE
jgi:hypothetical protein